jgi:hypothetical protein
MRKDWPTELQDMQTAYDIAKKHAEFNDDEPLGFLEVVVDSKHKPVEFKMPAWILDLLMHFRSQYGHEHGHAVISNVLTKLLLQYETVH